MSIKGRDKNIGNVTQLIGIADAKVVAFNPSKEELEKILNTELKDERNYVNVDQYRDGRLFTIGHFVLEVSVDGKSYYTSVRIPLSKDLNRLGKDGDGSFVFFNKRMNVQFRKGADEGEALAKITDNEKMNWWYDQKPVVTSKVGQADFYNFLFKWLNLKDIETVHDAVDWDKLVNGNFKVIQDTVRDNPENMIKVLLTVREADNGQLYQEVYSKEFWKYSDNQEKIKKFIEHESEDGKQYNLPRENNSYYIGNAMTFDKYRGEFMNDSYDTTLNSSASVGEDSPF